MEKCWPQRFVRRKLVLFDEIRGKLEECKDKHLRNDILLKNNGNEKSYKNSDQ